MSTSTTTTAPAYITRDGQYVATLPGGEDDALAWFHRHVGYSMDHALTHEGYAVTTDAPPHAVTKTIGRDLPNGDYIEIKAEERDGTDGLSAGFAITLTGWEKRGNWNGRAAKRNFRDAAYGGADHRTILAAAPELAPIVAAHLAAPDGTPMHAEANGWYFYSGDASAYERRNGVGTTIMMSDHDRAARTLHIPSADLPADLDRDGFAEFVRSLADRWAGQAAAARAALAAMIDADGVED
jgi:hypothetical protein